MLQITVKNIAVNEAETGQDSADVWRVYLLQISNKMYCKYRVAVFHDAQ